MVKIGIIGGSGLDDPKILKDFEEKEVETPYGKPSSKLICGKVGNAEVVIVARHGKNHEYPPSQVNYRANIYALKKEGCNYIIATTACGSLREYIERGDFVIPDQFIDFTKHRKSTFFESFKDGLRHTTMAEPFSKELRNILIKSSKELGFKTHEKGTVVTIEGPRFSTKAESRMFRIWGADIINMTVATEAALANELGIPYAAIAMSTDFDCFRDDIPPVTWEEVLKIMERNAKNVKKLIIETIKRLESGKIQGNFD